MRWNEGNLAVKSQEAEGRRQKAEGRRQTPTAVVLNLESQISNP